MAVGSSSFTFRMDDGLRERVRRVARASGRSEAGVVKRALMLALPQLEEEAQGAQFALMDDAAVADYVADAATALLSRLGEARLVASGLEVDRLGEEMAAVERERRRVMGAGRAERIAAAQAWVRRVTALDEAAAES